jgi:hypothetical protein
MENGRERWARKREGREGRECTKAQGISESTERANAPQGNKLVLHERNEWRHHQRRAAQQHRRILEAQTLPVACHQGEVYERVYTHHVHTGCQQAADVTTHVDELDDDLPLKPAIRA